MGLPLANQILARLQQAQGARPAAALNVDELIRSASANMQTSALNSSSWEAVRRELDVSRRKLEGVMDELPTPYEDPFGYLLIHDLVLTIEASAADVSVTLPARPVFGTLITPNVNTQTIRAGADGSHVVVVESALFNFALLFSKAVARCFPLTGPGSFRITSHAIEDRIRSDASVLQRFADAVEAYVVHGNPGLADPYLVEREHEDLARTLRLGMELFILGHEYGHAALGHLNAELPTARLFASQVEEPTDALAYSWAQEYLADAWAVPIVFAAMRRTTDCPAYLTTSGAALYFAATTIIDQSVSLLQHGSEGPIRGDSHPPSPERLRHLDHAVRQFMPDVHAEDTVRVHHAVAATVAALFARIRPRLIRGHELGLRPAARWSSIDPNHPSAP